MENYPFALQKYLRGTNCTLIPHPEIMFLNEGNITNITMTAILDLVK